MCKYAHFMSTVCVCVCVCIVQVKQKINQAYESLHVMFRRSSTSEEAEQDGVDAPTLSNDRDSSELHYFLLLSSHCFPFLCYCVFCLFPSFLSLLLSRIWHGTPIFWDHLNSNGKQKRQGRGRERGRVTQQSWNLM